MSRLRRLIVEIHDRSLWQVLLVYVGGSWAVLEAVALFRDEFGLPEWLFPLALALLIVGAVIVVALSFVPVEAASARTVEDSGVAEGERVAPHRRFLTWRNAGFAFVGVLAMWGLVAVGWVVLGGTGLLLTRAAAAGFVEPEDCIVVAEFENETETAALGLAVREAVVTDIGQSSYVTVLGYNQVRETLGLMHLPDTTHVDQRLALEIASRENCTAVVSGTAAPLGTGYILSARIIEASTGEEVVPLSETAVNDSAVVPAAERLARLVRRHLGEALPSIRRSDPLERVTTRSLEALRLYSLAARRADQQGDPAGAIRLLEQAVALDTAFAGAYRKLSAYHQNVGSSAAAQSNSERSYRLRERLPLSERLRIAGHYHWGRGRLDSAVHYYRMGIELYPNARTYRNNLGLVYYSMGRYEEALQVQHFHVFQLGAAPITVENLVYTARTLGRHALADSGLAILRERLPPGHLWTLDAAAGNAYYAGDLLLADSLAREMVSDSRAELLRAGRGWLGWGWLAGLASMRGRVNEALALADSAAALAFEANAVWTAFSSLASIELTSLAQGAPERAIPYLEAYRSQLTLGNAPYEEHRGLGVIAYGYALAGNLELARDLLAVMDSLSASNDFRPSGTGEQVLALIALQEGRAEDAMEHLRRAQAADFGRLRWEARPLLADAKAALGHLNEAIAQYDTLTGTYRLHYWDSHTSFPLRPQAHERLGSLYLQVGDTVSAARHLGEFIELWEDADPELQPRLESARRLLAQLAAEGT